MTNIKIGVPLFVCLISHYMALCWPLHPGQEVLVVGTILQSVNIKLDVCHRNWGGSFSENEFEYTISLFFSLVIWNCNSDTSDQVLFLRASQEIPSCKISTI